MLAETNYSSVDMVQGQEILVRESNKQETVCDVTENTEGCDSSEYVYCNRYVNLCKYFNTVLI